MSCSCFRNATSSCSRLLGLLLVVSVGLSVGCSREPIDLQEVEELVRKMHIALERIHTANWRVQWARFTTGKDAEREFVPGGNLPYYAIVKFGVWQGRMEDPEMARSVELLYRHTLNAQLSFDAVVGKLAREYVEGGYRRERLFEGVARSDNELNQIARFDADDTRRKAAWLALHGDPAGRNAHLLSSLFTRRNEIAEEWGFDSFYDLTLRVEGLDRQRVDLLLRDLEQRTREAARQAVGELARERPGQRLRPWDLEQQLSEQEDLLAVKPLLSAEALVPRLEITSADLGLPLASSSIDIHTQTGLQGTFLTFPVKIPDEVHLLIGPAAGRRAYRNAFRELGRATYYASATQPSFADRLPPNHAVAEGIAMIFARLPSRPQWLERYVGVPAQVAAGYDRAAKTAELIRLRRLLATHRFELAAYRNPEQDLAALYAKIMSEVTFVDWQDAGRAWASSIGLATQPFASRDDLLARLIQAQVYRALQQRHGAVVGNAEIGPALLAMLVEPGCSRPWEETIRSATGAELSTNSYLEDELHLE